jgi:hypothetical protein
MLIEQWSARASRSSWKNIPDSLKFVSEANAPPRKTSLTIIQFGLVKLVEGDALAVHCMLEWIYTGDYEDDGYDYAEGYGGLRLNMLVLEVADMYKLPNLWRLARKKFTAFGSHMYLHPSFAEAVEILWTLPMKHEQCIRDSVLNICVAHATELFGDAEARQAIWSTNGRFGTATDPVELKGVYENMPRFASDLAARMAKKLQPVKVRPPRRGEERDDFRQKDPPAQPYPKAGVVVPLDKERLAKWAAFVFDKTGLTGM